MLQLPQNWQQWPVSDKAELLSLLTAKETLRKTTRLKQYKPYAKQLEYHAKLERECLFMAGNQLGKTLAGAAEDAIHLTGQYPDWWTGHRFTRPIVMIAGSESYELTRDGLQRLLIGPPAAEDEWGTGMIPKSSILGYTRRAGVSAALDTVSIAHVSGGTSTLLFKAYEQGRGKWQANTVDYVHFDEEPSEDVYTEGITRTNATKGLVRVTFTPLMGMSNVVRRFLSEESPDRVVVKMTIDDAEHYTPEDRARIIASYPEHERDARTKGEPTLGSGRIYPVVTERISVAPFEIPRHWPQIGGLDFGWDHPTAAVNLAWDRDSDVIYVTKAYRRRQATPLEHAAALKPWGNIVWAWPHDGKHQMKDGGKSFAVQYEQAGLRMMATHATHRDGGYGVEAGISEILIRMQSGRFKVFSHLTDWFDEFRLYHRKDGLIVKEVDDVMDATRTGIMMLRFAEAPDVVEDTWERPEGPDGRSEATGY